MRKSDSVLLKKVCKAVLTIRKAAIPMWFEDWFDTLVFADESILASGAAHRRTLRLVRKVGYSRMRKHISNRVVGKRSMSTAAKDG